MQGASFDMERSRELLRETIVDVLRSWPDVERRVFVRSHYRGESPEAIAISLGLRPADVRPILEHCERQLRAALKTFRDGGAEGPSAPLQPPPSFASSGCVQ